MRRPPLPPRDRRFLLAGLLAVAACTTPNAHGQVDAAVSTCGQGCSLTECATAESGVEFLSPSILNAERTDPSMPATMRFMYSYMDGTSALTPSGYNPPSVPATRCMSDSNQFEFHISGGPFLAWGGGMGVSMAHFNGMETNLCGGTRPADICPPVRANDPVSGAALDLSDHTNSKGAAVRGWDGVSFWARRGPASQPLLRVLVGDKFTDDDLSYLADTDPLHLAPKYCERI